MLKGCLLAATALGALLLANQAHASERKLISGDNIEVVASDGWCSNEVNITIVSDLPEQHYSGNFIEVQRLLGGLRAVLPFECPQVSLIKFTATDGKRTPLVEGSISQTGGWRLTEVWEVEPPTQVAGAKVGEAIEQQGFSEEVVVRGKQPAPAAPSVQAAPLAPAPAPGDKSSLTVTTTSPPAKVADEVESVSASAEAVPEEKDASSKDEVTSVGLPQPPVADLIEVAEAATMSAQPSDTEEISTARDYPKTVSETSQEAAPVGKETFKAGINRLWQQAAVDFSNAEGDMIGLWSSPLACKNVPDAHFVTASVIEQTQDRLSTIMRREVVSARPNAEDPRQALRLNFVGRYEAAPQGSAYVMLLRDYFFDRPNVSKSTLSDYERQKITNLPMTFVEALPGQFEPTTKNCATTLVKISDDLTLAEKQWQTWQFAALLSDYIVHGQHIHGEFVGAKRGPGFSIPGCSAIAEWVGKYDLDDRLVIGNHKVRRLWSDDNFIPVFGDSYAYVMAEERQALYDFARQCVRARDGNAEIIKKLYNSPSAHRDINGLVDEELYLSLQLVNHSLLNASDPKYFFYALNPETAQNLLRVRFGTGADASRYLRNLPQGHHEEYARRVDALSALATDVAVPSIMAEYPVDEQNQRYLLSILKTIEQSRTSETLKAALKETAARVAELIAPKIEQQISEIKALPNDKASLDRLSSIERASENDLEFASDNQMAQFFEAVKSKKEAIDNVARRDADERLQVLLRKNDEITLSLSSLDAVEERKNIAASITDATPELRKEAVVAFDNAKRDLQESLVAGALDQVAKVEEQVSEIPFTLEGSQQIEASRKRVEQLRADHASDQWADVFEATGKSEEFAERLDGLSTTLSALEQGIPMAVLDDVVKTIREHGVAVYSDQRRIAYEAASAMGTSVDWRQAARMHAALVSWIDDDPELAVTQMQANGQSIYFVPTAYHQTGRADMPEAVEAHLVEEMRAWEVEAVRNAYGVDLDASLSETDVMTGTEVSLWLDLLEEAITDGVHELVAEKVIEGIVKQEREALAGVARANVNLLFSGLNEVLEQPIDENIAFSPIDLIADLATGSVSTITRDYLETPESPRAKAVEESGSGLMSAPVSSWTELGYPEIDEAIKATAEAYAERLALKLRSEGSYSELMRTFISEAMSKLTPQEKAEQYAIGYAEYQNLLGRFEDTKVYEHVEAVLTADLDHIYNEVCAEAWLDANLSNKDRAQQVLSSRGQAETLESLACRLHISGAKLLKYEGAGTFGSEHELMFETPEGDVLTAILVEAEVRPGQKMLVGRAMKDPLSQWDVTASDWRKQVEELVSRADEVDPDAALRR